jgi:hypothetical protein
MAQRVRRGPTSFVIYNISFYGKAIRYIINISIGLAMGRGGRPGPESPAAKASLHFCMCRLYLEKEKSHIRWL